MSDRATPDYDGIAKLVKELYKPISDGEETMVVEYNISPTYMNVYRENIELILDEFCTSMGIPNTNHQVVGAMWTLITHTYMDVMLNKFEDLTTLYLKKGYDINDINFTVSSLRRCDAKQYVAKILHDYYALQKPKSLSAECSSEGLDEEQPQ